MDTRLQNFWKESINKEMTLRFAWQARYANNDRSKRAVGFSTKPVHNSTAIHNSIAGKIRRLEAERDSMRTENLKVPLKATMETKTLANAAKTVGPSSDMRPASSFTRSLLYKGLSVHGEGRYAYLKRRNTIVPDQKYLYPVLSSNEYGWKILDHTKLERSPHGHASVIRDSFYRNSGVIFQ